MPHYHDLLNIKAWNIHFLFGFRGKGLLQMSVVYLAYRGAFSSINNCSAPAHTIVVPGTAAHQGISPISVCAAEWVLSPYNAGQSCSCYLTKAALRVICTVSKGGVRCSSLKSPLWPSQWNRSS